MIAADPWHQPSAVLCFSKPDGQRLPDTPKRPPSLEYLSAPLPLPLPRPPQKLHRISLGGLAGSPARCVPRSALCIRPPCRDVTLPPTKPNSPPCLLHPPFLSSPRAHSVAAARPPNTQHVALLALQPGQHHPAIPALPGPLRRRLVRGRDTRCVSRATQLREWRCGNGAVQSLLPDSEARGEPGAGSGGRVVGQSRQEAGHSAARPPGSLELEPEPEAGEMAAGAAPERVSQRLCAVPGRELRVRRDRFVSPRPVRQTLSRTN